MSNKMEEAVNDRETEDPDNVDLVTLDFFDDGDQPAIHKFELSDVRLVRRKTDAEDPGEEFYDPNNSIAEESIFLTRINESRISNDALEKKIGDDEDNSSEKMETDKNGEEFLEGERRGSKISVKRNSGALSTLDEEQENKKNAEEERDETAQEDEITTEATDDRLRRNAIKFAVASEIEKINEEMEEYELSTSEDFQQLDTEEEITRIRDVRLRDRDDKDYRLSVAKSRLFARAASILEQRLKTMSSLKEMYEKRKKIALKNRFLNKKCCEYIKKTTTVNLFENTEGALPLHGNQRYHDVLEEYIATKIDYENRRPLVERDIKCLADSYHICRTKLDQIYEDFRLRETEIGLQCVTGKTGKSLGERKLGSLMKNQQLRFTSLAAVRVNYLRLTHLLADLHGKIREMDRLGGGHTLMDYEQLMLENSSHVDKLDERDEELQKLRDKCAQCVSILSHLKETSDVFVYEIMSDSAKLAEVMEKKNEARTLLAIERQKIESLRKATSRIRQTYGLLDSPIMLRKMEIDLEALDVLKEKIKKGMVNRGVSVDRDNVVMSEKRT